ncbi:protein MAINTENANCE OF MERISTEMS-like [Papaver somniferum]|uniref:protein MAINTENANCE OF MERISTEMS-like n=1 Tax=Papaver somniferum TaxID=3469 RepID=UPI000E6FAFB7|nr:protein MAINTENANCE OF MERISTEMS-like [Papaver somniferum]
MDGHLSKKFNLSKLKDTLSETKKIYNEEGRVELVRINTTASAYLLHILGKYIFPDNSGSLVDVRYMQLLDPLDKIDEYSWGTAVVSFLKNELTKASRELTANWIYEHFPTLVNANSHVKVDENVAIDKPRGQRYSFKDGQDKETTQQIIKIQIAIDKLTVDEVTFDPYRDALNQGLIQRRDDVALYYDPLFLTHGYSMYDPHRVIRQLGYIQEEPHFDAEPDFKVKKHLKSLVRVMCVARDKEKILYRLKSKVSTLTLLEMLTMRMPMNFSRKLMLK